MTKFEENRVDNSFEDFLGEFVTDRQLRPKDPSNLPGYPFSAQRIPDILDPGSCYPELVKCIADALEEMPAEETTVRVQRTRTNNQATGMRMRMQRTTRRNMMNNMMRRNRMNRAMATRALRADIQNPSKDLFHNDIDTRDEEEDENHYGHSLSVHDESASTVDDVFRRRLDFFDGNVDDGTKDKVRFLILSSVFLCFTIQHSIRVLGIPIFIVW